MSAVVPVGGAPGDGGDIDEELQDQMEELRSKAIQGQKIQELGPQVVDDDLTWLADASQPTVDDPNVTTKEQLASAVEADTSLRLVYSGLRNSVLRRELKLQELADELRQLQKEATDTPQERRQDAARVQALAHVEARVQAMELKAVQTLDYSNSLHHMLDRLQRTKHHGAEALDSMKEQMSDIAKQIETQRQQQKSTSHRAWQDRNAASVNLELFAAQAQMREKLKVQRRGLLEKASKEAAEKAAAEKAARAATTEAAMAENAESMVEQVSATRQRRPRRSGSGGRGSGGRRGWHVRAMPRACDRRVRAIVAMLLHHALARAAWQRMGRRPPLP